MVSADATDLLHGQILRKKLKKNTWREYWVVLRQDRLVFMNEDERKVAGIITLTHETTCKVLGQKTSSSQPSATDRQPKQDNDDGTCKFKLRAKRGVHLLKTDCKSSCEKWIEAISRAVQNMWDNSANSATSTHVKKHIYKIGASRSSRDCRKTKRNSFSYTSLSEEDEDADTLERSHGKAVGVQRAILTRLTSTKGKFEKWIHFPGSRFASNSKSVNYGVLVEDTTD